MSGIAGILSFENSPEDLRLVNQITAAMQHRGPDATAHWNDSQVALGHCMLRTTPQSLSERQPLVHEEPQLVMVMDGRIDNRKELHSQLHMRFELELACDADFVLEAYKRWGEDCPGYLLGEFAFAIWDVSQQRLFCARDQLGSKVISYFAGKRFVAFASEPDALFDLPGVSNELNEQYLACMFVGEYENRADRRSYRKDIAALLEGESMTIAVNGRTEIRRYWQAKLADDRSYKCSKEAHEHFIDVFGQSVRDRMRSSAGVSLMMSGGLDSASVAVMARRHSSGASSGKISAFSVVDDSLDSSLESRCILQLGKTLDLEHQLLHVPSMTGVLSMRDLVDVALEGAHPIDNSILLPSMIALAASRAGSRVMLHGACGDLAMNVPLYYPAEFFRRGKWLTAWRESKAASMNNYYLNDMLSGQIFRRSLYLGLMPQVAISRIAMRRFRAGQSPIQSSLINPDFASRIQLEERLNEQILDGQKAARENSKLARMCSNLSLIRSGLSGFGRVAARHGIELRDPWADLRVLDYFSRLPTKYKVRDGWLKHPVRVAFPELPDEVRWRQDKEHLGWKLTFQLVQEKGEEIRSLIEDNMGLIGQYADADAVRALCRSEDLAKSGGRWQEVFNMVTLGLWLLRRKSL